MTAAELRGAGLRTADRERLQPTDLVVRSGRVTAVVGRNGSGKSTLLGLLAGELSPTSGAALVGGDDIAGLDHRDLARRRALLTQETQVSFGFTVEEVVRWGRTPWRGTEAMRDDDEVVEAAITAQGLADLRRRPVTSLSGGERKRVHLARVAAQQAPLLLLDEADADLDLVGRRTVDQLVQAEARAGRAVVVVTHDLARIGHVADDVVLMKGGRILASGHRDEVLTEPLLSEAFGVPVRVRGSGEDLAIRPEPGYS